MKGGPGVIVAVGGLLIAGTAAAEVKQVGQLGFEVGESVAIAAPPAKVFDALSRIGSWWNPQHTFSGNAGSLHLELKPGGCFCEVPPVGGGYLHMTVVGVQPGKFVRLRGALGPLQNDAVDGTLTWAIAPAEKGLTLTQTYVVGGYFRDSPARWAPSVDAMLHDQLTRLKSFVETGSPEPKAK
jgi:uncharacterized protein YndB with AHSA1/START domain